MADADVGMDKAELKKLLMLSKKQPVHCGLGLTKDGVVIKLDKIKSGKVMVADLQKSHKDMKSPHWGEAFVDTDEDPKLVILTLNKAAPGMARKMKKTLKGTGFSKVEIRLEDGSVADKVGEEEEEGADEPGRPAPPQEAAADAQASPSPPDATEPSPPDAAEPSPPAAPVTEPVPSAPADPAVLLGQLTALVKRMMPMLAAGGPAPAVDLKGMAGAAQARLKAGDVDGAQASIASLQQALDQAEASPQEPPASQQAAAAAPAPPASPGAAPAQTGAAPMAPNMAALGKAKVAWVATRQRVEGELDKLHAKMTEVYKGHGFAADLDKVFRAKVEPMLGTLDHSLSDKLDEVAKNTDAAQHPKLVQEARQIIAKYESYLASEPLIAKLDDNPFVPLAIQKTLTATLTALSKSVV